MQTSGSSGVICAVFRRKQADLDRYKYGLPGAYEPKARWMGVATDAVGIDVGNTLLMIDAYRRGLIYKLSDQNSVIQKALYSAGFL